MKEGYEVDFLIDVYNVLLPIILTGLMGWIGSMLKDQKKEKKAAEKKNKQKEEQIAQVRKANSEGIKLVLRYMLNRYHTEYMIQGKITYSQYKDWMDLFAAYRALGGNSIAMDWNDDIEKMDKCNTLEKMSTFEAMVRQNLERNDSK